STGIVMVAGGEYFSPTLITLRMIRRKGCKLPVEVFLGSQSEYEPELCNTILPTLGATCIILTDFLSPPLRPDVTHYQLKSLALIFSTFERVLYLDSDSIPIMDPTPLFTTKPFTDTGLVLWPDFWMATEDPVFYNITGVGEFPSGLPPTGSEAGQILVDKKRQLTTLLLAAYYNVFGPGYYYELLSQGALGQGDKETFLAAALVLKNPWTRVRKGVDTVGYKQVSGKLKGSGMVQFHPGDDLAAQTVGADTKQETMIRPAFIHANTPKMNAGHLVDEGDLFDGGKRVRLWGSKEEAVKRFGGDIERVVWKELVGLGCELANVVREWKGRDKLCERLKEHWKAVFENDA
ncbi:mannosyltransferase putative-domain-containing protein, partial [Trichophaea hybrida]